MALPVRKQISEEDTEKEREHFRRIICAFRHYKDHSLQRVFTEQIAYQKIPDHHKALIPDFPKHMDEVRHCIAQNYELIKNIIKNTNHMFENEEFPAESDILQNTQSNGEETPTKRAPSLPIPATFDMDKVKTTLKQFVRDWSTDGKAERDACYKPVLEEIQRRFPRNKCNPSSVYVLVPGAGLGRLAHDIARLGYNCQGNEWSLFMLFASHFVLNRCHSIEIYTIHPWVHQWCNNMSNADQLKAVKFPDINPSEMPSKSEFSMAAGDFLEVYTEADTWDCIATVFFIDTAHNVIAYLETIWKILKPGGYWINMGPLLYHFADMPNELSIELSYEDVKKVILQLGFLILEEKTNIKSGYTENPKSMLKYVYDCVYFVAQKPLTGS
ncbi:carnosine N-methyltransferase [Lingula anatina]|uniref:Carnosine N-methyltransferase n=1 Tax=Lingula anatina TaxID=7574 RepID=A0A1S3JA85_LINAN|nr:carnosine N-methyltransferase [Lingula anatina]|eukprot:XP_013407233.1 carnosine N-methyltransferase [Lingula anatina]